jgi:integrase
MTRAERDRFFDDSAGWSNPLHTGFEISAADREPYEPFNAAELSLLFTSPIYAEGERPIGGRGDAAYWLPVLSLYTGARRTELAQLTLDDVKRSPDGIWFIDITAAGEGRSVKNPGSERSVPVHEKLIDLGFIRYLTEQVARRGPSAPLWKGSRCQSSQRQKRGPSGLAGTWRRMWSSTRRKPSLLPAYLQARMP